MLVQGPPVSAYRTPGPTVCSLHQAAFLRRGYLSRVLEDEYLDFLERGEQHCTEKEQHVVQLRGLRELVMFRERCTGLEQWAGDYG